MNTYKCRMVVPKELPWREVQEESEEAATSGDRNCPHCEWPVPEHQSFEEHIAICDAIGE